MREVVKKSVTAMLVLAVVTLSRGSAVTAAQAGGIIEVSGTCSLAEAIQSANFDSNVAFASYGPDVFRTTGCAPGSGDDTIVLPAGAVMPFDRAHGDAYSPFGRAALPVVFSTITIEGNGARLEASVPEGTFRAFSVGETSVEGPDGQARTGTGNLTVRNLHIKGFAGRGGDAYCGGGGGMGAGGAFYAGPGSVLTIEHSTLELNGAIGGNASIEGCPFVGQHGPGGGGGGLGGNGGRPAETDFVAKSGAGGGGGGSGDHGGDAELSRGGGGGGTLVGRASVLGGYRCGGKAGPGTGENGADGACPGGGGGGAGEPRMTLGVIQGGVGGHGAYGGGGGGGGATDTPSTDGGIHYGRNGGAGGFGGGGGACGGVGVIFSNTGGGSVFGGGGGRCSEDPGGSFIGLGGSGTRDHGGGGAGLGGAVFSHFSTVMIRNSTLTGNYAVRGTSQGRFGNDLGGAVFAFQGALTILNSTIAGNENTGAFGGVVYVNVPLGFLGSGDPGAFTMRNTIIAHNGVNFDAPAECALAGGNFSIAGSGNLIMRNATPADDATACPGVVITADPQLGVLRLNAPGSTPTMALPLDSVAVDAADPGSSLESDQRGRVRPLRAGFDIGAVESDPDFHISAITPVAASPGETVQTPVTITSIDEFSGPVALSLYGGGPPRGFTASFGQTTLTPAAGGTAATSLSFGVGAAVVPGNYMATVLGSVPGTARGASVTISVTVTTASLARTIDTFSLTGCISNTGVAGAFKAKLANSDALRAQGRVHASLNALLALRYQVEAQSGRHVVSSCTVDGTAVEPTTVLMANLDSLLVAQATGIRNPVIGAVLKSDGVGVAGATAGMFAGNRLIASVTTDPTGFYYLADTSPLTRGATYAVKLTALPAALKAAQVSTQSFKWSGTATILGDLVIK